MSDSEPATPAPLALSDIPSVFVAGFENRWQRFVEACERDNAGEALECAESRNELPRIWVASEFVANACIHRPRLLHGLVISGSLDRSEPTDALIARIDHELSTCIDEADLNTRLRRIRKRELVRLAWRDLAAGGNLEETIEGVSALAEICIEHTLSYHHGWLGERFGMPRDESDTAVEMVVLGLGKLGGKELNYSSDIDLMFAYDGAGQTDGARVVDNQEYFIKLGRKLVSSLDQVTAEGFVFRTDMRLRPNGESGPLVLSFAAMEHYYQTHGRGWERYALIKARVVGGDKAAGQRLLQMLNPFIYRKYLDFGAFESIREMKRLIERELQKKSMQDDIKLGQGGIREIEFLVQSHQLIRGGRERSLQTQSLFHAMTGLVDLGVLDPETRSALIGDYRFLRNTEHRLQMVADRQTQRLPDSDQDRLRLAWSMGFDSWDTYSRQLICHRKSVHSAFGQILGEVNGEPVPADQKDDTSLTDLWQGVLEEPGASNVLREAGFSRPESMPPLLHQFRNGRLYQSFSGIDRDRIDRLIPLALRQAGSRENAERAVTAFIAVIESIGRRSVYLSLLIENPLALRQLLALCAASPWISQHIGRHPVIMDELLSPRVDIRNRDDREVRGELEHRLAQIDSADLEIYMNTLREFNHAQILRVAAADVLGVLEVGDVHRALSQLAEVILSHVFKDALDMVMEKLGTHPALAGIIGYGKFASGELGYHSDLDIVVCFDANDVGAENSSAEIEYFYSRVGQRLIHLLTTRTHAGQLYELDMRLRPSGRSGTLVTSLAGFIDYQLNNAWTWEHQALVRARAVVGSSNFSDRFEQARKQILCQPRDPHELKLDIVSMKRKMVEANSRSSHSHYDIKLDWGGIVDIEFLIQYLVLREANNHAQIVQPRTTDALIEALQSAAILSSDIARELRRIYQIYLRKSLDLKLMDQPMLVAREELGEERQWVQTLWAETFG